MSKEKPVSNAARVRAIYPDINSAHEMFLLRFSWNDKGQTPLHWLTLKEIIAHINAHWDYPISTRIYLFELACLEEFGLLDKKSTDDGIHFYRPTNKGRDLLLERNKEKNNERANHTRG